MPHIQKKKEAIPDGVESLLNLGLLYLEQAVVLLILVTDSFLYCTI